MGVVPARCRAVPAGAARWIEPGGVSYGALAPHVATDGAAASAGAISFAPTLPMQVSRASHRRSDPTTQSDEHERYQGGFVGDDGRSQTLLHSLPPRHGTCLWLDYYHHGPPHTHLSSALVFTHAALPSPSAPSSLPAPSVSRLHLPLHPHLNLAHPSLFAPPFPSPSSPRLRPPPTLPSYPYRAPPLTYMHDIHKASARVRVATTPFALAAARASAFETVLSIQRGDSPPSDDLPPPLPHPKGCGGGGFNCVGVVLVCGQPPALPSVLPGRVKGR